MAFSYVRLQHGRHHEPDAHAGQASADNAQLLFRVPGHKLVVERRQKVAQQPLPQDTLPQRHQLQQEEPDKQWNSRHSKYGDAFDNRQSSSNADVS